MTTALPSSSASMSTTWLKAELERRGADVDVLLPYLLALPAEGDAADAETAAAELLAGVAADAADAAALAKEFLSRWLAEHPASASQRPPPQARPIERRKLAAAKPEESAAAAAAAETATSSAQPQPKAPKDKEKARKQQKPQERPPARIVLNGELAYFEQGETLFTGHRLTLTIEDTLILDDGQLSLLRGHRYGLLGPNGAGKTTLLNALRAELASRGAHGVMYVGQTDGERLQLESRGSKLSLVEHVMSGDEQRNKLLREAARLRSQSTLSAEDAERLGEIEAEIESDEGKGELLARSILERLGFAKIDRPVAELSGGWRSRLEIARALWANPRDDEESVLMLDEPTNHLELEAILQLAGILRENDKRTLLLVSHDAAFLDMVCTDVICLYSQTLKQFDGNYSAFEEFVSQTRTFHHDINEAREKKEAALKHSIQQQRQRAARSRDSAAQKNAAARVKKIERVGLYREDGKRYKLRSLKTMDVEAIRLPLRAEPVREGKGVNMKLPAWYTPIDPAAGPPSAESAPLLQTDPLVLGPHWGTRGKPLLRTPALSVVEGDRVAIVGANGCGKSTLLKALSGQLAAEAIAEGAVHTTSSVAVIDQNQLAALDGCMEQTPLQWIIPRLGAQGHARPEEDARKHLSCFAIGPEAAETRIAELSGGLRVRLLLAGVFVGSPKVLMLDEPTNHLDGESILAFVELCRTFPGAIVGISHSIAFLLQVFHDLWIIENGALVCHKTRSGVDFAKVFEDYARPLIGEQHRDAFQAMLKIRAARSTLVVQSESATTGFFI